MNAEADDYTKEVLRDAIPLLEQLLERLKVLAGVTTTISVPLPPTDAINFGIFADRPFPCGNTECQS